MKKPVLWTVIGGVAAGMLVMALWRARTASVDAESAPAASAFSPAAGGHQASNPAGTAAEAAQTAAAVAKLPPPTAREIASMRRMSDILHEAIKPGRRLENLLAVLQAERQEPFMAKSGNADTGDLTIVRTKNPLPGTRYFHAQYFTAENGSKFLQHISFEFKPGSTSFEEATARQKELLGPPNEQRGRFMKWNLPDRRILWVAEPSLEQLLDDPFNAHTREDLGTVVIAVEQEIH